MTRIELRPSQVVIHLGPQASNRANLWLPELIEIGATGQRPRFANDPAHPVVWLADGGRGVRYDLELPERLALAASIRADASGYALELAIGNLTGQAWPRVHAAACMQLTLAASYLDLSRERTRCVVNGNLVSLSDMDTIGGKPEFLFAIVDGHIPHVRHGDPTRPDAKWCHTAKHPDDGFICVTTVDSSQTVWMGWEDVQFLQNNVTPAFGCIHANPYFGDIGSGERVLRRGRVGVVDGGPDEAYDAFVAEFGSPAS